VLCEVLLEINEYRLVAGNAGLWTIFMALAAGEIEEDELTD